MKCFSCNSAHNGLFGSGKFCSRSCANKRTHSEQTKNKISSSLLKERPSAICKMCGGEFIQYRAKRQMCSKECRHKSLFGKKKLSQLTHEKLRQNALRRHAKKDGNIGFTTRKKFKASFPEKVTEDFFTRHLIEFEREVRIGRWFADFVFNKNIVLEIDGKQHELPERKESDRRKDAYFLQNGYSVVRIPFNGLSPEFFEKLNDFLRKLQE